jgi:hypothetical protein
MATAAAGPHGRIPVASDRERLLAALFDQLWETYRQRVSYVRDYERVIAAAGATFVNDHIAFRTIASQQPTTGIVSLSRLFEALDYVAAGCYQFPDKHLSSTHFQHPNGQFPKLFVSELRSWELSDAAQAILGKVLRSHRAPPSDGFLARLSRAAASDQEELVRQAAQQFEVLPWDLPEQADVVALNSESQFGAWVLVQGYQVNHFTSLINSHNVEDLADIDRTVAALKKAGIPLKAEIEGAPASKLRQTATEAVTIPVGVRKEGKTSEMPWTYAYFELAERGEVTDPQTGRSGRFEGFLGPQATNLFEMTRVHRAQ